MKPRLEISGQGEPLKDVQRPAVSRDPVELPSGLDEETPGDQAPPLRIPNVMGGFDDLSGKVEVWRTVSHQVSERFGMGDAL